MVDVAISGSGRAGALHHEIQQLEADMSDPAKADQMDEILAAAREAGTAEQRDALAEYEDDLRRRRR